MIPLGGLIVYTNNNRKLRVLAVWFVPVVLIPLIWAVYSISIGSFDEWLSGVLWQGTERQTSVL
jgi:hypothetical protein